MNTKLSIIIPVYNVEKYLHRCMDSILANNGINNCEIILVDDGSKDKSPIICDEYAKKYDNIIAFHTKNGGASSARNYGITKATGDYIWFIDSDDKIDNCIEYFINIMKNEAPDIIVCQSKIVNENNDIYDECKYTIPKGNYTSEELMSTLKKHPKSVIFCPQYYIVRRNFIIENSLYFYEGIIYEDELWIPQLLLKSKKIYYSNKNIYYHFMISTSVMHSTKMEKCGRSDFIVATELFKIFDLSNRKDLAFLRDRSANIFLQAVWKISNFLEEKENINRALPLKNSYFIKTRFKSLLYFFVTPNCIIHCIQNFQEIL